MARAADGIAATAAVVGAAVKTLTPAQPIAKPTTRDEAIAQALPAIVLNGLAVWRAVSELWVAVKAPSADGGGMVLVPDAGVQ